MVGDDEWRDPPDLRDQAAGADIAEARREAVAALISEDLEAFATARRAAQRALVHAVENSATTRDVRRSLARFATEASRDYAARALSFDAHAGAPEMPECRDGSPSSPRQSVGEQLSSVHSHPK